MLEKVRTLLEWADERLSKKWEWTVVPTKAPAVLKRRMSQPDALLAYQFYGTIAMVG